MTALIAATIPDCDCDPLPPACWLVAYGLWPDDDVSTRTTDVTDEEISQCL
jgi:hypothetical protein